MGEYFGAWQPQSIGNYASNAPVWSLRGSDAVVALGHLVGRGARLAASPTAAGRGRVRSGVALSARRDG